LFLLFYQGKILTLLFKKFHRSIGTIGFFIWTLKYVSEEGSSWTDWDTISLIVLLLNLCSNFVSMLLFVSIKFIFLDVIVYIAGLLMFLLIM
jgi:hypothetical protein